MADRTSASIFGMMFKFLAENPDKRAKKMARKLMDAASDYDFDVYQMDCDKALKVLDLIGEDAEIAEGD